MVKVLCLFMQHYYGKPERGLQYEWEHIAGALAEAGHSVGCIDILADDFMDEAEAAAPEYDLVLYNPFEGEMDWTRFAALPIPRAVLLSDDDWRRDYGLSIAPYADFVLANGRDSAAAYGKKFVPFQWGVRPSLYWDGDNDERPVELAFVGQAYGDRPYLVDKLRRVGLQVAARGLGWQEGAAETAFIPRLLAQSRVGLNFNKNSRDGGLQIKARSFEVAASGACLLTEYAPGLEDYFTHQQDAVFWSTERELVDSAIDLISNPAWARQIGRAARARALAEHTYARRFEPLWERLTR